MTATQIPAARRYAQKIADGRGLYPLLAPNGGRYWRHNYRFEKKSRTLALGVYPDVSLEKARARHQEARCLLADGIDASTPKQELVSAALAPVCVTQQVASM